MCTIKVNSIHSTSLNAENNIGVNALLVLTFCTFFILVSTFYFYHF